MAQEVTTVPQDANYLKKWQTYGTPPWYAPVSRHILIPNFQKMSLTVFLLPGTNN
jgi:hypothetical protein